MPIAVKKILEILDRTYPDAKCALNYRTPFELLVATMLSAQSTDRQVNEITRELFQHYNTPEGFATLNPEELAGYIKGCGLYQAKSRNIIATARKLLTDYGGEVPESLAQLVTLPGVGRKTANVVLSNAFGQPAIAVDTHVFRVANRLGLADSKKVDETEDQLRRRIPRSLWSQAHHWLIFHGRQVCHARRPKCFNCPLVTLCRSKKDHAQD
ncbi:MAG: endonuclease III [Clostridia bacterium]|nr:endonuclease III [Clostridia bacterium]